MPFSCKIARSFVFVDATPPTPDLEFSRSRDRPAGNGDTAPAPKALMKGKQTRAAIVDAALALASQIGLEGLSIGTLAEVTGMSKSGVFAHFGSREELQISVVREYHARFEDEVFRPSMACRGACRGCACCSTGG